MFLYIYFYERLVVVYLFGSLEKVAFISLYGCMFFCDDGRVWSRGLKKKRKVLDNYLEVV